MSEDVLDLLALALKLPPADRAALVNSLIDSLDTHVDEEAEDAWRTEVRRQALDLESGAEQAATWDDVRNRLRSRLPG